MVILFSRVDRTDDRRGRVFTTLISTGAKEWEEFFSEGATSKGRITHNPQTAPPSQALTSERDRLEGQQEHSTHFIHQTYSPETSLKVTCD